MRIAPLVVALAVLAAPSVGFSAGEPEHADDAPAHHAPDHHAHADHAFAAGDPGDPGDLGDPGRPARVVPVTMREMEDGRMAFFPADLQVVAGEQVRFVLRNAGRTDHEFILDTAAHNAEHKLAMQRDPGMMHRDPNGTTVAPAATQDLVWRFTKPGTYEFACLIPGHYEAGMHGQVSVR